jgi:hypothetical protein
MAPELLDDLLYLILLQHPNFNSINNGDFATFCISHDNDNETADPK